MAKHVHIARRGASVQADGHYRYMMPALDVSHFKRNTLLANLGAVAKALHREPDHILRFIAVELSVPTASKRGFGTEDGQKDPGPHGRALP